MVADLTPSEFRIRVIPSASSNDHQCRIDIDGMDWLGSDRLGLDPPDLAVELIREDSPELTVGRCECGTLGCDDARIGIERNGDVVIWRWEDRRIAFGRPQYDEEVRRFISDNSWRPVERQAEASVEAVFDGLVLEGRLAFRWASARIRPNVICLSFETSGGSMSDGYEQRMLEFGWDGRTVASAVDRATIFRSERFETS